MREPTRTPDDLFDALGPLSIACELCDETGVGFSGKPCFQCGGYGRLSYPRTTVAKDSAGSLPDSQTNG